MIALQTFNQLSHEEALAQLQPCVALPDWADALVRGGPIHIAKHCSTPPGRWHKTGMKRRLRRL